MRDGVGKKKAIHLHTSMENPHTKSVGAGGKITGKGHGLKFEPVNDAGMEVWTEFKKHSSSDVDGLLANTLLQAENAGLAAWRSPHLFAQRSTGFFHFEGWYFRSKLRISTAKPRKTARWFKRTC